MTPARRDQARKTIFKTLKELGLNITLEFGLKQVDYLDATMNLTTDVYKPYRKPNDKPVYINKESNHPPSIIRELFKMVVKRLNNLSSNEQVFKEAIPPYQEALKKSGYTEILKFDASKKQPKKKQRKRNITYYNPPFNAASDVNLGKEFLKLVDKHFPKNNKRKDELGKCMLGP